MGKRLTQEEFEKKLFDIHKNTFSVLDDYKNNTTKIRFFCHKCNHEFLGVPASLLAGSGCPICANQQIIVGYNDMWTTHPGIAKLLLNKDDGYCYAYGTNVYLNFICPYCNNIIYKKPRDLYNKKTGNIRCQHCGDGLSYPEKFLSNVLSQLQVNFKYQLTNKDCSWCKKYRYDFYIKQEDCIIEVHGEQHYRQNTSFTKSTLQQIIENDNSKQELAMKYVDKYIIIDARISDPIYLKNSIIHSEMSEMFLLDNIDWDLCAKNASTSLLVAVCNDWDMGVHDVDILARKYCLHKATIYGYLESGLKAGFCSYNKEENLIRQKKKQYNKIAKSLEKPVLCIETGENFTSIKEAQAKFNIKGKGISKALTEQTKTAYGYHWKYLDTRA